MTATAAGGVVRLQGVVPTLDGRHRAVALAMELKGVSSLVDDITVRAGSRSDGDIERDVKSVLAQDPAMRSAHLGVRAKGGVVTLTGSADS